ncbi:hypothetical protein lbkm_0275 [Lachnospiraceae bacterium KM106-2]|nr:hypothetical protein lbkm_0275 [Lachnospiraceae bacterium KM106-2]
MNLDALNTPEFQEDLANAIQQINERYHLSIKCSQISYGSDYLTIYVDEPDEDK